MKKHFLFWVSLFSWMTINAQDGSLDASFNSTGWKSIAFAKQGNIDDDRAYSVLQQGDSKYIVLAMNSNGYGRLVRYNNNGTLDTSYGTDGFSEQLDLLIGQKAVMQDDDKVVVVGYEFTEERVALTLARFDTNGMVDPGFGNNGYVLAAVPPYDAYGVALAIDKRGNIVVTGIVDYYDETTGLNHNGVVVMRFTSQGVLDTDFNATGSLPGTAIIDLSTPFSSNAVAIQNDGKIVIGGSSTADYYMNRKFTLVRIHGDGEQAGSLDLSFGNEGIVTQDFGNFSEITDLLIQDDNKIVAGGSAITVESNGDTNYNFVVSRYLNDGRSDGTPDPSFNAGGAYTGTVITGAGGDEYLYALAITNNQLTAAGTREFYNPTTHKVITDFVLVRYKEDGTLDNDFDSDGIFIPALSGRDFAVSMLIQTDGAIVVAGYTWNDKVENLDVLLVRFTASLTEDASFNSTGPRPGMLTLFLENGTPSRINALAVQQDGKIIVAGMTIISKPDYTSTVMLALSRLHRDGTIDTTFGDAGITLANFGSEITATSLAISATGSILIGGYLTRYDEDYNYFQDFIIAQFTKEGSLDTSFHKDGWVVTDFNNNEDELTSLAIQPDGKIVAGGLSFNYVDYSPVFMVTRYTVTGDLDSTFGSAGVVKMDMPGYYFRAMALQPGGKIVLVGMASGATASLKSQDIVVARLTSDGLPDKKFGTDGNVITSLPGQLGAATSVAIQPDGKILVSGLAEAIQGDSIEFVLLRFSGTGVIDKNFGDGGTVSFDFPGYQIFTLLGNSVGLQKDGKIIVTNQVRPSTKRSVEVFAPARGFVFGLARFTSQGSLDETWGTKGKLVSDLPGETRLYSALWNNGRMYTVGSLYRTRRETGFIAAYTAGQRLPYLSINDVVVNESAGKAILTVSMDKASTTAVMTRYATEDNTATFIGPHADYRMARGVLTLPAGTTAGSISVDIVADKQMEAPESFFVNLSLLNPMSDHAIIAEGVGMVTITEGPAVVLGTNKPTRLVNRNIDVNTDVQLTVRARPNPSTGVFTLELESAVNTLASLRIMDVSGRLMETKNGLSPNSSLQLGAGYKPGAYYAEVVQGNEKVVVRLVKL